MAIKKATSVEEPKILEELIGECQKYSVPFMVMPSKRFVVNEWPSRIPPKVRTQIVQWMRQHNGS